jgi:hypothetical protein
VLDYMGLLSSTMNGGALGVTAMEARSAPWHIVLPEAVDGIRCEPASLHA